MESNAIFKIYLKKNIFLVFFGLTLGLLFFAVFATNSNMNPQDYDPKIVALESAFHVLKDNIDTINDRFDELKSKISVVGTFHFKYLKENSIQEESENGPLKLVT